jgi:hypothetical protein
MTDSTDVQSQSSPDRAAESAAISIVQRGNLKSLEKNLRKQWRLGQSIVLCWSADERGLLVLFVPHYFLGNYCAVDESRREPGSDNESFIRELISGKRRKTRDELFAIADRLSVAPTFIKLSAPLSEESNVVSSVEELIKRYGLSYVNKRAVLLFDLVQFSLYTPFEQASQLNSLSYSLNSAYNKLLAQGIEVNFARTTTGDGYYVWNRNPSARASEDLYYFLLLVLADNAVARAASKGNTVPVIRTAYHIGSHYELYQAEGVSPTVFSYIVGDVTIELARMVDLAQADQVLMGDFSFETPPREVGGSGQPTTLSAPAFVRNCNRELGSLSGIQLSGKSIRSMSAQLTEGDSPSGDAAPRRFRITDKHGLTRHAYNLQVEIGLEGGNIWLGLDSGRLPGRQVAAEPDETPRAGPAKAASAEEMYDDLAIMLKKRAEKAITED